MKGTSLKEELYHLQQRKPAIEETFEIENSAVTEGQEIIHSGEKSHSLTKKLVLAGIASVGVMGALQLENGNKASASFKARSGVPSSDQIDDNYNKATLEVIHATADRLCHTFPYDFQINDDTPYNQSIIGGWGIELNVTGSTFSDLDIKLGNSIEAEFEGVDIPEIIDILNADITQTINSVYTILKQKGCRDDLTESM